jgi:hypothetical protein
MSHETDLIADDFEQARLYAWNDPILDRALFEERLQNEPHLADLVAEAVSEYLEIRAAIVPNSSVKKTLVAVPTSESHRSTRYLVNAAWTLSIAVAIAVLLIPVQWNADTKGTLPLSSLAQIWSELHYQPSHSHWAEQIDSPMDTTEEYSDFELSISDDLDLDLPDWLVAATSYQTSNTGVTP